MAEIHGRCGEEFVGVREAFARNLDSGADVAILVKRKEKVDEASNHDKTN